MKSPLKRYGSARISHFGHFTQFMDTKNYSLLPIAGIIQRSRNTVIIITLSSVCLGLLVYLIRPKQYKARVEFFLKNPLYADKNYMYNSDARMIDYFAGDEDIDRMRSMIWADSVQDKIIREMGLPEV